MSLGTMSEEINVPRRSVAELSEGFDPVVAAGMVNPAMSSWMAFQSRTREGGLAKGFGGLILGVTSAGGPLAVSFAKKLGAGRVVGLARNAGTMEVDGLDERIVVAENAEETDFRALEPVDVIVDYVGGSLTTHLLNVL